MPPNRRSSPMHRSYSRASSIGEDEGPQDLDRQLLSAILDRDIERALDALYRGAGTQGGIHMQYPCSRGNWEDDFHALHLAAALRHDELITFRVADPVNQRTTCMGATPIYAALYAGEGDPPISTVKALLLRGADPRLASTSDNDTPLHAAVQYDSPELIELLVRHRADVNACNDHGVTPLRQAVELGAGLAARALLDRGADPNPRAVDEQSVLQYAVEAAVDKPSTASIELVRLLVERGACTLARDAKGATIFHWVAESEECGDLLRWLVQRDRRGLDALDQDGQRPVQWAEAAECLDNAQVLRELAAEGAAHFDCPRFASPAAEPASYAPRGAEPFM